MSWENPQLSARILLDLFACEDWSSINLQGKPAFRQSRRWWCSHYTPKAPNFPKPHFNWYVRYAHYFVLSISKLLFIKALEWPINLCYKCANMWLLICLYTLIFIVHIIPMDGTIGMTKVLLSSTVNDKFDILQRMSSDQFSTISNVMLCYVQKKSKPSLVKMWVSV